MEGAGLRPRMPMPMPKPVRSGLVATPSCPFFICSKGGGALTIPYANAHANARALWVSGPAVLLFLFLLKVRRWLTIPHAYTHAYASALWVGGHLF